MAKKKQTNEDLLKTRFSIEPKESVDFARTMGTPASLQTNPAQFLPNDSSSSSDLTSEDSTVEFMEETSEQPTTSALEDASTKRTSEQPRIYNKKNVRVSKAPEQEPVDPSEESTVDGFEDVLLLKFRKESSASAGTIDDDTPLNLSTTMFQVPMVKRSLRGLLPSELDLDAVDGTLKEFKKNQQIEENDIPTVSLYPSSRNDLATTKSYGQMGIVFGGRGHPSQGG
ncbi:MAG: hypothetical protein AAGJ35_09975, partial [Myxococcota bacterium]